MVGNDVIVWGVASTNPRRAVNELDISRFVNQKYVSLRQIIIFFSTCWNFLEIVLRENMIKFAIKTSFFYDTIQNMNLPCYM